MVTELHIVQGFDHGHQMAPQPFISERLARDYAARLGQQVDNVIIWRQRIDMQDILSMTPGNNTDRDVSERGKQKKPGKPSDPGLPGSQRGKPKPVDSKNPKKR